MKALLAWFADAERWSGDAGIPARTLEHLEMCALVVACAAVVAVPLGVWLGHARRGDVAVAAVLNIGRAMPSFAILALALPVALSMGLGLGFWPTWLALFVLAIPPMFTNAATAVREVDAAVLDAGRGMGMRERAILTRIELPLAAPLILAGVRTSTVQVIATAPLGALVAWGGLGRFIVDGLATRDFPQLAGGALLVAALAIVTELAFGWLQRAITPGRAGRARATGSEPGSADMVMRGHPA